MNVIYATDVSWGNPISQDSQDTDTDKTTNEKFGELKRDVSDVLGIINFRIS